MNFIKAIRVSIALCLLVILAVIVRYFLVRSSIEVKVPEKSGKLAQQKIERKEKVEYLEIRGEEKSVDVKADRNYIGSDGKYYLEGNVEVIFFKRKDEQDVHLFGEEVVYDRDWTLVISTGQAKAKFKDLVIEATQLNYDNQKEIFKTESGVHFSSPRIQGPARKMIYMMKQERLKLEGDICLQIKPDIETSLPLEVRGESLDYNEVSKKGVMRGQVQLFHGKSHASSDVLRFRMFQDAENIETLILEGNVKASLFEEDHKKEVASQKQSSSFQQSVSRQVEADKLRLRAFSGLSEIEELEAKGNCSLKFFSSDGGYTQILADSADFIFDRQGEIKEFKASKEARIIVQGADSEEKRIFSGEIMTFEGKIDALHVRGRGPYTAQLTSSGSDIFAEEIFAFTQNNDLEAKGGVKVILKSKEDEKKPIGIFSDEQPVFIIAKELRYLEEQRRFLFSRDIKAWQEKKTLLAEEFVSFEETGNMEGSGGVTTVIPHKPRQGEKRRLEISSRRMMYSSKENRIDYEENVFLKVKDAQLHAQSISVYLREEDGELQRLVARGNVSIVHQFGEAKGEEARYDLEEESFTLLGNPVLIDKDRGRTEGDKLTFYMGDGRILVENEERERSVSIIKRER